MSRYYFSKLMFPAFSICFMRWLSSASKARICGISEGLLASNLNYSNQDFDNNFSESLYFMFIPSIGQYFDFQY